MQLTDAEIREILKREKRRKRLQQRRRRRLIVLLLLIIIIAVILAIKFLPRNEPVAVTEAPRGIIFIDPGHGGEDPGSDNGARYEKEDVLKLSQAIKTYLEGEGFEVHMSRTSDTSVESTKRPEMANECKAQLYVSVHRNDADGKGEGVEAFIPKENTAQSRLLAESLVKALVNNGFTQREVMSGTLNDPESDYPEISGLNMPACLIEVGFISSMEDNELFDTNLDANAKAMSDSIVSVFASIYEPQPAETEEPEKTDEGK